MIYIDYRLSSLKKKKHKNTAIRKLIIRSTTILWNDLFLLMYKHEIIKSYIFGLYDIFIRLPV